MGVCQCTTVSPAAPWPPGLADGLSNSFVERCICVIRTVHTGQLSINGTRRSWQLWQHAMTILDLSQCCECCSCGAGRALAWLEFCASMFLTGMHSQVDRLWCCARRKKTAGHVTPHWTRQWLPKLDSLTLKVPGHLLLLERHSWVKQEVQYLIEKA